MNRNALKIVLIGAAGAVASGCQPSREEVVAAHQQTISRYCLDCHNYAEQVADLSLEPVKLDDVAADPEKWEKVVRKLRAGMMPPSGNPRPEHGAYGTLASWIESELDRHPKEMLPPPGLHRLNRAEYANAVRDLLALDIDAGTFLPADDSSRGFDNQAGALGLSPALLEAYLSAPPRKHQPHRPSATPRRRRRRRIASPTDTTQNYHVEGLPFGTRGGLAIEHTFPSTASTPSRCSP